MKIFFPVTVQFRIFLDQEVTLQSLLAATMGRLVNSTGCLKKTGAREIILYWLKLEFNYYSPKLDKLYIFVPL